MRIVMTIVSALFASLTGMAQAQTQNDDYVESRITTDSFSFVNEDALNLINVLSMKAVTKDGVLMMNLKNEDGRTFMKCSVEDTQDYTARSKSAQCTFTALDSDDVSYGDDAFTLYNVLNIKEVRTQDGYVKKTLKLSGIEYFECSMEDSRDFSVQMKSVGCVLGTTPQK